MYLLKNNPATAGEDGGSVTSDESRAATPQTPPQGKGK
jgi:hypothetical protein